MYALTASSEFRRKECFPSSPDKTGETDVEEGLDIGSDDDEGPRDTDEADLGMGTA